MSAISLAAAAGSPGVRHRGPPRPSGRSRGGARWYRQPALMAGLVIIGADPARRASPRRCSPRTTPIPRTSTRRCSGFSAHHLLGTDQEGRDTFTRLLYGGRVDLRVAFIAVLFPFVLGTILGSLAGYFGGWIDIVIMRLVDIVVAFPFFVLVIALVFVLGPGERSIYIAITLVGWVSYARIIRGEILVAKRQEYVLAAQSGGLSQPAHHAAGTCCRTSSRRRSSTRCPTSSRTSSPSSR